MSSVRYEHATRVFPKSDRPAVDGLSLTIPDGEFLVLVGPSGCGKSTSLRMLAGLEEVDSGTVSIGERDVTHLPPKSRDVAMVFQSYALYPHMTVADNIGFALKLSHVPRKEIRARVAEAAKMLDLEEYLERKPKALSGGQRQRVAMGRAIVRRPQVFLLDEPLSNLDAKLRVQTRTQIASLQRRLGTTTVYVTHDQVEAMTMGDRVAVMRKGELQQVAPPQELYDRPVNLFVGGFIGSPAMNMLDATVQRANGTVSLKLSDDQSLEVDPGCLATHSALTAYEGRHVVLGIRPETLEEASLVRDTPATRRLTGRVELREALGSELMVHVAVPHAQLADTEETKELARESTVEGGLETAGALIVGRFSPHARVQEGETVEVAVDTSLLHFFDPDTGLGIYEQGNEKGAST